MGPLGHESFLSSEATIERNAMRIGCIPYDIVRECKLKQIKFCQVRKIY